MFTNSEIISDLKSISRNESKITQEEAILKILQATSKYLAWLCDLCVLLKLESIFS